MVRYAFFIEEAEAMAERLGALYLEIEQASPRNFGAEEAARASVFQYMVGNTDWSMVRFHNAEVLQNSERVLRSGPLRLRLDGFVSARYARPDERLRIRNVRQRITGVSAVRISISPRSTPSSEKFVMISQLFIRAKSGWRRATRRMRWNTSTTSTKISNPTTGPEVAS